MGTPEQVSSTTTSAASRKMAQAYLEQSIAELESQLRQACLNGRSSSTSHPDERKACLLDISMLVHALPLVRKWCRTSEYTELLLPIDGQSGFNGKKCQEDQMLIISHTYIFTNYTHTDPTALAMLDILKKAEQPLCAQAREAIRWLERQLSLHDRIEGPHQYRHKPYRKARLRILGEDDMLSWSEVLHRSRAPSPAPAADGSPDTAQSAPDWKAPLHEASLGTQALFRAFLGLSQDRQDSLVIATAARGTLESQPDLIKRVLADQLPLEDMLRTYFPDLPTNIIRNISEMEASLAEEEENAFWRMQKARAEERIEEPSTRDYHPHHHPRYDRRPHRPDSGYHLHSHPNHRPNHHHHHHRESHPDHPHMHPHPHRPHHHHRQHRHAGRSGERSPQRPPFGAYDKPETMFHAPQNSSTSFWNEPPPVREAVRQPKLLQNKHSNRNPSPSPGHAADQNGFAPTLSQHTLSTSETTISQPPSQPKIMLANPRSTARSLSTAT